MYRSKIDLAVYYRLEKSQGINSSFWSGFGVVLERFKLHSGDLENEGLEGFIRNVCLVMNRD